MIEIPTREGPFGLVHVVRDADIRSVADITAEIRAVKADSSTIATGRLLTTLRPALGRVPGLYALMYAGVSRSRRAHLATGTVQVTALGMFGNGGRWAIAPPTLASLLLVVGGVSRGPRVVGDRVEIHDVLDLTQTIDNIVYGSPAARFAADLRQLLQTAAVLDHAIPSDPPTTTQEGLHQRASAHPPEDADLAQLANRSVL